MKGGGRFHRHSAWPRSKTGPIPPFIPRDKGTDSTVHSMGPTVWLCLFFFFFVFAAAAAIRVAGEESSWMCKTALSVVCVFVVLCFVLAVSNRFSGFFCLCKLCFRIPCMFTCLLLNRLFGARWRGRTQRNWRKIHHLFCREVVGVGYTNWASYPAFLHYMCS